jgi:hypothetical protein
MADQDVGAAAPAVDPATQAIVTQLTNLQAQLSSCNKTMPLTPPSLRHSIKPIEVVAPVAAKPLSTASRPLCPSPSLQPPPA